MWAWLCCPGHVPSISIAVGEVIEWPLRTPAWHVCRTRLRIRPRSHPGTLTASASPINLEHMSSVISCSGCVVWEVGARICSGVVAICQTDSLDPVRDRRLFYQVAMARPRIRTLTKRSAVGCECTYLAKQYTNNVQIWTIVVVTTPWPIRPTCPLLRFFPLGCFLTIVRYSRRPPSRLEALDVRSVLHTED